LSVRDGATGAVTGTVPTGGFATHPDFAAAGNLLAFTRTASAPGAADWSFGGGEIATIPFDPVAGTWGTPTTIVTGGGNNYYPSLSPDGQWVLFNRSTEDAYDDASAELWVVRIDGSGARKLDLANVGPGFTNSWARWAPFRSSYGPEGATEDLFWITWSSKRDFGVRLVGVNRPQLWMTPFFPERVAAGNDPTARRSGCRSGHPVEQPHRPVDRVVVPIGRMVMTPLKAESAPARPAPGDQQVALPVTCTWRWCCCRYLR
jgi:hypothetical protein